MTTENPSREALRQEIAEAWGNQAGATLYRRLLAQNPDDEEVIEELFAEQMRESLRLDEAEAALRRAEAVFEEYLSDPLRHPAAMAAREEVVASGLSFPEWLQMAVEDLGHSASGVAESIGMPRGFFYALERIRDLPRGVAAHLAAKVDQTYGIMREAVSGALSAQVQVSAAHKHRGEDQPGGDLTYREAVEQYVPADAQEFWLGIAAEDAEPETEK